jgi:DNA-binding transcriptional ArsR family regulator
MLMVFVVAISLTTNRTEIVCDGQIDCAYGFDYNYVKSMKSTYLRFLSQVDAFESTSAHVSNVDQTAKQLLNAIALCHAQGRPMTVKDAMSLSAIASPSTIHSKLNDLRESELIEQVFEGRNRRTKYLVPTSIADKYFSTLDELMHTMCKDKNVKHVSEDASSKHSDNARRQA